MTLHNTHSTRQKIVSISAVLILILTPLIIFSSALQNQFVNYDDWKYIVDNPVIQSLTIDNIRRMFTEVFTGSHQYHPLTFLTWAIEYHFVQLTSKVYILDNIFIHILNTLLVFILIRHLSNKLSISFLAAFIFSLHPLRVESVVWATERKDVLYSFFYLSGLIIYDRWLSGSKKDTRKLITVYILYLMSCLSKPMAVSFPLALITLDYFKKNQINPSDILEKALFLLIACLFGFIAISQKSEGSQTAYQIYNYVDRLILAVNAFWFYLGKLFLPINLSCYYPLPEKINNHLPVKLYGIFAASIIMLPFILRIKNLSTLTKWGGLFYLSNIVFVVGFLSFGSYFAADRYTYLASIGWAVILSTAVTSLFESIKNLYLNLCFAILLGGILIGMQLLTFHRIQVWQNGIQLWTNVITQFPKSSMAFNNRANAYLKQNLLNEAFEDYNRSINLQPLPGVFSNRGIIYFMKKDFASAIKDFSEEIRIDPHNDKAFNNRGAAYREIGRLREAVEDFNRSIQLKPVQNSAYYNRAKTLEQMGKKEEARQDYEFLNLHFPGFIKSN